VQLAHAAGDQLGELAAEVEDDDGVRLDRLWRAGGPAPGRSCAERSGGGASSATSR